MNTIKFQQMKDRMIQGWFEACMKENLDPFDQANVFNSENVYADIFRDVQTEYLFYIIDSENKHVSLNPCVPFAVSMDYKQRITYG